MKSFLKWLAFWGPLIVITVFLSASATSSFTSEGDSMYPTLTRGKFVIVNHFDRRITENVIVTLRCYNCGEHGTADGEGLRKRIIRVREDNCIWIEGDNKAESYDSRAYGWVCPRGQTPGKPEYIIDGRIYPWDEIKEHLRSFFD